MSVTYAQFKAMEACRATLLKALTKAQDERKNRRDDWVEYELTTITDAANRWALNHGLSPVTEAQVAEVEVTALGHVDYSRKWCLYITDLLYGLRHQP